ncbi:hypothetical protein DVH24_000171 [Malus domestica]|uniref:Pentatricopeptide repeat-containing protein n=1 Tax=Malus domestica TaxID=3750 RepID=A0A498J3T8_MALDO|nr:hypothetical protein DVH24_000171 [Malus domestica]
MDEKGFPPCPSAYCSLINNLGRAKLYEATNEVYGVMIKHFGKCGRLDDALDLFYEMKKIECTSDVYAYNALISGIMRADMIDEAHSLLKVMEENDCILDLNSHNIIFNGLARTGGPNQDLEKFSKTKHSKIELDDRAGLLEEAAKLMKGIRNDLNMISLLTHQFLKRLARSMMFISLPQWDLFSVEALALCIQPVLMIVSDLGWLETFLRTSKV